MVEIIIPDRSPAPEIHIHWIERTAPPHGQGIGIKVYGQMKVASDQIVYAREFKLNTIVTLQLTPHVDGLARGYIPSKWIYNKGEYDNYASIHVFDHDGNEIVAGHAYAPSEGSIWLDFIAGGE